MNVNRREFVAGMFATAGSAGWTIYAEKKPDGLTVIIR